MKTVTYKKRRLYLIIGVLAMLFAGVIYTWSILKAPLADSFGWTASQLALNFTLTMCFYCIGCIITGIIERRIGVKITIIIGAVLAFIGFQISARLSGESVIMLYFSYGFLSGMGIGMAYSCIISAVGAWFPEKKGTCTGVLMMAFGASTLVLGNLADVLFKIPSVGWRGTFTIYGIALGVVLLVAGLIIKRPGAGIVLPEKKAGAVSSKNSFAALECTTLEMIKRPSFWLIIFCITFLAAVGNSTISFARDFSISVGAAASVATALVGVLSVCNGLGRIFFGFMFDLVGCKKGLLIANIVGVAAACISLVAVVTGSVAVCVIGLCFAGLSYGACPTAAATVSTVFYGQKHFPLNYSIVNLNLIGASFLATVSSLLLTSSGGYVLPFAVLAAVAVVSLILNVCVKKP